MIGLRVTLNCQHPAVVFSPARIVTGSISLGSTAAVPTQTTILLVVVMAATGLYGVMFIMLGMASPSIEPPPCCSPLLYSLIVGPYKDEGLVVYTKQDNTLHVHNPVERKWKTLVENIVEKELLSHTMHLHGNIFYTFHAKTYVLEAYDISENKRLPQVQFEKDFPYPVMSLCAFVISDGMLCFTSLYGYRFYYTSFFINYTSPEPKPCLMEQVFFKCQNGNICSYVPFDATT